MKDFYTYDQQIDKLKDDGLIIQDESFAIEILKNEGYYNLIKGYSSNFKTKSGMYIAGTTFEDICSLYAFDKNLRSIIYKYTSSVETHIKALIAHEFSRAHGVDEKIYLDPQCFTKNASSSDTVSRLISDCSITISEALNKNSNKYRQYIAYNYNEHGHVPLWALMKALSFGTTSIFYKNMIDDERDIIASNYYVTSNQLANMLEVVVSYRNIVAHGERAYCAKLPKTRLSTQLGITKKLNIAKNEKGDNMFGRNDFLALLICCKYLLTADEFSCFMQEVEGVLDDLSQKLSPDTMCHIKTSMGIRAKSWKLLPKLRIC